MVGYWSVPTELYKTEYGPDVAMCLSGKVGKCYDNRIII